MAKIILAQFKISVPKPKRNKISDGITRTTNKIIRGKVIQDEEGNYKVVIKNDNDKNPSIYDFTERSYNLEGRTDVFSRHKDEHGKRIRVIRNATNARFMPGLPEQYTPFAPNWLIDGYIVKDKGILKFDFKRLVGIDGYVKVEHFDDD